MFNRPLITEKNTNIPRGQFNWGGFFLTWIWAIGNDCFDRTTFLLLAACFIPYVGVFAALGLMFYCGYTGSERALKNKTWNGKDHFDRVQKRWAIWGTIQFVLAICLLLTISVLVAT